MVSDGAPFIGVDKVDAQALRVYILALALRALTGTDHTDICAFADSLRPYDGLSPNQIQSAQLMALVHLAESSGADDPGGVQSVLNSIHCAHCCGTTSNSLKNAESVLLCMVADNLTSAI